MKNKTMNLILTVSAILFCCATIANSEPIEILFKNREHLKQWVEELPQKIYMPQREPYYLHFREINQKDLDYWKRNKDEIINAFIKLYGPTNEIQTGILISILNDLPREMDRNVESILKKTPYPYLNKHRAMIINILKKGDNINRFSYLAAVIDPPADMKKKLLASDKLDIGLRARLGDKKIEEELIQKVNDYNGEKWIGQLVNDLFLCGTNECLKAAFELFVKYEPAMNRTGDCALGKDHNNRAPYFRNRLIGNFLMYYPELPLLQKYNGPGFRFNWDMTVDYMEEFVKWGNAKYGSNAKLENWFLFPDQCEPVAFRERSMREQKAYSRHDSLMRDDSGYRKSFLNTERELDSLKRTRRSKK